MVVGEGSENVYLSGRNLPKTEVIEASDLNTYDILNADMLILTEGAVEFVNQSLAN